MKSNEVRLPMGAEFRLGSERYKRCLGCGLGLRPEPLEAIGAEGAICPRCGHINLWRRAVVVENGIGWKA